MLSVLTMHVRLDMHMVPIIGTRHVSPFISTSWLDCRQSIKKLEQEVRLRRRPKSVLNAGNDVSKSDPK